VPTVLVLDNLDSFTFTLVDYLVTLGATVSVVRSQEISVGEALAQGTDGLLISPGPGRPEDAGISVDLARACMEQQRPLVGICLGHQAIALAAGGQVARAAPVHGMASPISHDSTGLFRGLPSPMTVTRYNSLLVTDCPIPLLANAWAADGTIQGLRHADAPVHGVQFHPESIASEHGHALLESFLKLCS
jgi:anthranilate synthase component 2